MRFGRKQRGDKASKSEAKKQARQKIWEDPAIIEEIFKDAEWQQYDGRTHEQVPSHKMAQHIEEEIGRQERKAQKRVIRLRRSNQLTQVGVAAALLLFISFQLWRESQLTSSPVQKIYVQQDTTPTTSQPGWVSVVNDSEQVDTIFLPDQSTVHLFAQSSIRYTVDFSEEARDIHLEGKACFAVEKDITRPFSVYAGDTKTTAIGTSFTIDTRVQKQHTIVELHTGKVVVASTADIPTFKNVFLDRKGASLLLGADMRIVRHQRGAVEKVVEVAPMVAVGKLLHLENIPLSEVFVTLEEIYQQPIHIKDNSIKKIQYTGMIDSENEALADVLTVICLINDLRYEKEEDGIYSIYRQNENASTTQEK